MAAGDSRFPLMVKNNVRLWILWKCVDKSNTPLWGVQGDSTEKVGFELSLRSGGNNTGIYGEAITVIVNMLLSFVVNSILSQVLIKFTFSHCCSPFSRTIQSVVGQLVTITCMRDTETYKYWEKSFIKVYRNLTIFCLLTTTMKNWGLCFVRFLNFFFTVFYQSVSLQWIENTHRHTPVQAHTHIHLILIYQEFEKHWLQNTKMARRREAGE